VLLHVPEVLNADELAHCRRLLAQAPWDQERPAAQAGSGRALPEDCAESRELGAVFDTALARSTTFFAGALPRHIVRPLFQCDRGGASAGSYVDGAIRRDRRDSADIPVRTDLSAIVFLSRPDEYDGGDLIVEDTYGAHTVRLEAGDLILHPAGSLRRLESVTRGERMTASFSIQSLVRDESQRRLLLELDVSIQSLSQANAPQADVLRLTGIYHNLLRAWSET